LNHWTQRTAVLYLTKSGQELFASSEDRNLEVFVEWTDELGLWVFQGNTFPGTTRVRLIKWSHFESAVFDVVMTETEPPKVIGFRGKHTPPR
jgi:hypothetical protein